MHPRLFLLPHSQLYMGALLSVIALPAVGSIGSCLVSCCSAAACSLACQNCLSSHSILTRSLYVIAWLMMTDWAVNLLSSRLLGYLQMQCEDSMCYGVVGAHKVCFAIVIFHMLLGLLVLGVRDSREKRAVIQNGGWGFKVIFWLALVAGSIFIPNEFIFVWGNYITLIGACLFIVFGLLLLLDLAQAWTEICLDKLMASENNRWKYMLIGTTLSQFGGMATLTGLLYGFYGAQGCTLDLFITSFNLALVLLVTLLCFFPAIQEASPQSGLSQASIVTFYCTFQAFSAITYQPNNESCGPESIGLQTTALVLGAIIVFAILVYSATRSGSQEISYDGERGTSREYLVQSVDHGTMPRSNLDRYDEQEELSGTVYSYSFFHFMMAIAAMYASLLITQWSKIIVEAQPSGLVSIEHTSAAVWIKAVSSWICYSLYVWTLVAPIIMPDRFLVSSSL
ncbi:serine incorporator/TMS membrane protein [Phycomyces nitens]|nr:serine incorporator/TMS membrane protein [Phycomyces nitens]